MGSKKKTSSKTPITSPAKTPKAAKPAADADRHRCPKFSFRFAGSPGAEGLCAFNPSAVESAEIMQFIQTISTTTWSQIDAQMAGSHRRHHWQSVASLTSEAQSSLDGRSDVLERLDEQLYRFRLGGKARMWGFRLGATFYVLWWDPEHQVYPTEKKNT